VSRNGALFALTSLNDAVCVVVRWLCGALLATIAVTVFAQVVARYVFLAPIIWAEEASVFALAWAVLLGTSLGVRDRAHLVADTLPESLPVPLARTLAGVGDVACLVVATVFVIYGYEFAEFGWNRGSFSTGLPMFYVYISMPICGALVLLFVLERGLQALAGERP
jgi:TRAP-type C4-dicarboxylate transport system permease small subunit